MIATELSNGRADQHSSPRLQNQQLPSFPHGDQDHRHHRVEWKRSTENELTALGLLATALTSKVSPRARLIANMQMKR